MSVIRRQNFLSSERIDLPAMLSIESATSNDFDELMASLVLGTNNSYVLRGFEINMANAIGGASSALTMTVDPGAVLHYLSSVSGTFYLVPVGTPVQQLNAATNPIVLGAFSPSSYNYVSLELTRSVEASSSVPTYFWDVTTDSEITSTAPSAIILSYTINISNVTPASHFLPIAIVQTDAGNNVISIEDIRPMLFTLGTGGLTPNPLYTYPWPEGRTANPIISTDDSVNPFSGGDKALDNLKSWMSAIMTSVQEIKGTPFWFSAGTDGSLSSLREDLANTVVTGKGSTAHGILPTFPPIVPTVAGQLNWDQPIFIKVIGSELNYELDANSTSSNLILTDDQVAYITLTRGATISPELIFTISSAIVTSVGAVSWTTNLIAGDWIKIATDTDAEYYQILTVNSPSQVTLTTTYYQTVTSLALYAFGSYYVSATPVGDPRAIQITSRGLVPAGADVFWLFMRADNGGSIPNIYIRFLGAELEMGEDRQISDTTAQTVLQYIGSPIETAYAPQYVSALNPGSVSQITQIVTGIGSTISPGQYFLINSSGNFRKYYVWFKVNGTGVDPAPPYTTLGIEVDITTSMTAAQVAALITTGLNGTSADDFLAVQQPNPNTDTIIVTNTSAGVTIASSNFDVGTPFTVTTNQSGTGVGNYSIIDGSNLTLAIKELDKAMGIIASLLDEPCYDQTVNIVLTGATPPTSLAGPISATTLITLPNNSRLGNAPQRYTVGLGGLQVFLNGQYLVLSVDWSEVGAPGTTSNQIEILQTLVVGDVLEFRIGVTGGPGGGSGGTPEPGPIGPQGPAGNPGADAAGGPISISTKTSNYTIMLSDCFILVDCTSGNIIITLPTASSSTGQIFYVKKIDSTLNTLTVKGNGSDLIDGSNTQLTNVQWVSYSLISNGAFWSIF